MRGTGIDARAAGRTVGGAMPGRRGGFTLIEIALGLTVFVVALGGLMASIVSSRELARSNDETSRAYEAARRQLERIQNEGLATTGVGGFADLFRRYNDTNADDGGLTSPQGAHFAVPGLNVQLGDADGMCGRIEFPSAPGDPPTVLRENIQDDSFGLPRDLNGNGVATDAGDLSGSYTLLPVRVHVEWRGVSGDRAVQLDTFLTDRGTL